MQAFGKDWIFGNFKASDFGLIVAAFNYNGISEDESGFKISTKEQFIKNNATPLYLGDEYQEKLKPTITLCKNPEIFRNNMSFSQKECRELLRILTGIKGYVWTKIDAYVGEEEIWFKAKIVNISYQKAGDIVGFIFNLECDSYYGYSAQVNTKISVKKNVPFYIYNNTDDLFDYILPVFEFTSLSSGTVTIVNETDNSWTSEIKNIKTGEKITINSKTELLSSSISHNLLLNDFNLQFPRLVPEMNKYVSSMDGTVTFRFRVPRKVGL